MSPSASDLHVFWNERTLAHEPPRGAFKLRPSEFVATNEPHPDRPERIENIKRAVETALPAAAWTAADPATREEIERVHDPEYVDWFESFCADGGGWVADTTTGAGTDSFDAARHGVGVAVAATEHALSEDGVPYALCRPSGHHAQPDRADGFCFFNNVAVAAEHALATGDVERVAIVDWDVHHGNGTQEAFYGRDDVLYVSLHNDHGAWHPEYHPQTGGLEEVGAGAGEGYTVNVPVPVGAGDEGYAHLFAELVEPVVEAFDPDLVLASAGQDPGVADPLGRNNVSRAGFRDIAARTRALADDCAAGRLAVVQEGGYQITHLPFATLGVLEGALGIEVDLAEHGFSGDPFAMYPETLDPVVEATAEAKAAHAEYWPLD